MRPYLQNLKKLYKADGFKILRGYEFGEGYQARVHLIIVKTKKTRIGTLRDFCLDRMREGKSVVIVNPTTEMMINFLNKYGFYKLKISENTECGVYHYKNIDLFCPADIIKAP